MAKTLSLTALQQHALGAIEEEIEPGKSVVMTMGTGGGKALRNDTPIRTPEGWTQIGDLKTGQRVYDERGERCEIIGVYPQGMRDEWRVSFDDGSILFADAEHLWVTERHADRRRRRGGWANSLPITTEEMADTLERHAGGGANHSIPLAKPLAGAEADLPVPPYLLGLWLGDGTAKQPHITASAEDAEFYKAEIEALGERVRIDANKDRPPHLAVGSGRDVPPAEKLRTRLRKCGVLDDKHIPTCYLVASREQRKDLLQGLMDSDGTIGEGGKAEFTSTNRALAEGVLELIVGLGMKAALTEGVATINGRVIGPKFRIIFRPLVQVVRLPRKLERLLGVSRRETVRRRYVVKVERTGRRDLFTCIAVNSPHRLYLAGRTLIPTHNTEIAIGWIKEHHDRAVFLAPTINVARQTAQRLNSYGIRAIEARGAAWPRDGWPHGVRVLCTTYATAKNRISGKRSWMGATALVVDEAHHAVDLRPASGLGLLVQRAKKSELEVLGLTATLWRLSRKQGYERTWDALIQRESVPQLVSVGALSRLRLFESRVELGMQIIAGRKNSTGDYAIGELERLNVDNPIFTERAVQWWLDTCRRPDGSPMSAAFFCVSQKHALETANCAAAKGMRVGLMLSGEAYRGGAAPGVVTDDDETLRRMRAKDLDCLVNVVKAVEGVDVPVMEVAVILRTTESVVLYMQMIGRASRLHEDKLEGRVLDATDNSERFHGPMQHREWSRLPRGDGEGDPILRPCDGGPQVMDENCEQMLATAQQICPICSAVQGHHCVGPCGRFTIWSKIDDDGWCERCVAGRLDPESTAIYTDPPPLICEECASPRKAGERCAHVGLINPRRYLGREAQCECMCGCERSYLGREGKKKKGECCTCMSVEGEICGCNGGPHEVLTRSSVAAVIGQPWRWKLVDGAPKHKTEVE